MDIVNFQLVKVKDRTHFWDAYSVKYERIDFVFYALIKEKLVTWIYAMLINLTQYLKE